MSRIDFFNMTAHRVHGVPDGWQWYLLNSRDCPDGYIKVAGNVPVGVLKNGPRKGSPKFAPRSKDDVIWMKDADVEETKRLWSEETGKCHECTGSGKKIASVSVAHGKTYRPCSKCDGTGRYRYTCPTIDGVPVTGSACEVHGMEWEEQ